MKNDIVRVDFTPAAIECDFEAMGARLTELLEPYEGMTAESAKQLDLKSAKACRADLNAMKRELESARKAIKKAYNAPLAEFEERVKELVGRITEREKLLKDVVDAKVAAEREEKRAAIEREYIAFAPFLAQGENGALLPFDRICEDAWLNRTTSFKKAVEQMQAKVESVSEGYETLKAQAENLHCYSEDVAVYFRTLSLQDALRHDSRRAEEDKRLRDLQEQQAEQQGAEAQPSPSHEEDPNTPYVYEPDLGDDPYVPAEYGGHNEAASLIRNWVVKFAGAQTDADEVKQLLVRRGLHGSIGVY